ncbi:efflux RND transporter periplasmic adaptor subunit [Ectothiorhodospiraceae bacterium WFHF3C12]|nr:efflux RND transporter periplasmic adaptor subunit [Ectothiorhodospiraceae bacterium WFHF3C12]
MKKRLVVRLFIVVVVLAAAGGGIAYWKYVQIQQTMARMSQPTPPPTVSAAEVEQTQWLPRVSAVGSVIAINGVDVTTEVAGIVSEIAFESGQAVEAGDLLVQLEDSVDQAALEGLVADRKLAQVEFERSENLLPRRAVSQSQFDEAKARYESAQARVAEQRARIQKKSIEAPFDGVLGLKRVDLGEYLSPGNLIVELQMLDPIHVEFTLPERRYDQVSTGQPVEVRVAAFKDRVFEGEVTAIDTSVNAPTRSFTVRATVPNAERRLRPGMFAEVAVLERQARTVVTVPRTAISYNTYGDFVYRINEGDDEKLTVQRVPVQAGGTREGHVEILEGLEPGERVVSAGLVKLRNGQPVQIDNSTELDHDKAAQ